MSLGYHNGCQHGQSSEQACKQARGNNSGINDTCSDPVKSYCGCAMRHAMKSDQRLAKQVNNTPIANLM